jgi:hypothetical protein
MILALVTLALTPWTGPNPKAAAQAQIKYRLTISAPPNSNVHLRADNVASGWIAAFCNNRVCSPNQVTQTVPANGKVELQFDLIREDDKAVKKSGATIISDDGATIAVKPR